MGITDRELLTFLLVHVTSFLWMNFLRNYPRFYHCPNVHAKFTFVGQKNLEISVDMYKTLLSAHVKSRP